MTTENSQTKLIITLNGEAVIEYDRNKRLPGHQRQFLDKMDLDMARGFDLGGEFVAKADTRQRAKFVAMTLIQAIVNENDGLIAASCAYLANRLPELKQVKAVAKGEQFDLDLVFTETLENQVKVSFVSHNKSTH